MAKSKITLSELRERPGIIRVIPKILELSKEFKKEEAFKIYPKINKDLLAVGNDVILHMQPLTIDELFKNCQDWRKGFRGNEVIAILIFSLLNLRGKEQNEIYWRDVIWRKYGGNKEVQTPLGYVDLITRINNEDVILEFKYEQGFKHALGQILTYKYYFPNLSPGIVLLSSKYQANNIIPVDFKNICEMQCVKLFNINKDSLELVL